MECGFFVFFENFFAKTLARFGKSPYLCIAIRELHYTTSFKNKTYDSLEGFFDTSFSKRIKLKWSLFDAEIAQLVEHNLAKVGVASSSLVFRSYA